MKIKERLANLTPEQKALLLKRLRQDKANGEENKPAMPEIVPNPAERYEPFQLNNLQQAYLICTLLAKILQYQRI